MKPLSKLTLHLGFNDPLQWSILMENSWNYFTIGSPRLATFQDSIVKLGGWLSFCCAALRKARIKGQLDVQAGSCQAAVCHCSIFCRCSDTRTTNRITTTRDFFAYLWSGKLRTLYFYLFTSWRIIESTLADYQTFYSKKL